MGTIKRFLLSIIMLLLTTSVYSMAMTDGDNDDTILIGVEKKPNTNGISRPRTVCGSEIEAVYNLGLLTITFNEDLGDADIEVVNCSTGESWFDAANGICSLTFALSNDPGIYIIYITTDQGLYQGSFILY
ncbi:MAG: hypothetical protein J6V19_06235 [Alistipes sp.]|nr:hypothetical protein [Alistipes sp.]